MWLGGRIDSGLLFSVGWREAVVRSDRAFLLKANMDTCSGTACHRNSGQGTPIRPGSVASCGVMFH